MPLTQTEQKIKLYDLCKQFVEENNIWEACCITDSDNNTIEAIELVLQICEIVGYKEFEDEE